MAELLVGMADGEVTLLERGNPPIYAMAPFQARALARALIAGAAAAETFRKGMPKKKPVAVPEAPSTS